MASINRRTNAISPCCGTTCVLTSATACFAALAMQLIGQSLPVSTLGLSTLIIHSVSIPLGIRKAVHNVSVRYLSSTLIIIGYAIPAFLFAILLIVLFCRRQLSRLVSAARPGLRNFDTPLVAGRRSPDHLWHITLPVLATDRRLCHPDHADQKTRSSTDP